MSKKKDLISKIAGAAAPARNIHELAFVNAAQANIITTASDGKVVLANRAACKLLGYSSKELLTKNRTGIFDIHERSFKKMLEQRNSEGHSIAQVTALKKNGKAIPCEISSAVFTDEDGVEKAITSIADKSGGMLVQKNIDLQKEKIVEHNIVIARSKQKKIDSRNDKIVADNIVLAKSIQKEKDVKTNREVAQNIVLAKSKQKNIDIKKEKKVAHDIIVAIEKADSRQAQNNQWIKYIAKTSYDVMWDWDIANGNIYVGESIKEVFGYNVLNNATNFKHFICCLLPGEKAAVEKKIWKALASAGKSWKDSFMLTCKDGSVAAVTGRASIVRDETGKATHLIGNIQDVSRLQELESKLAEQTTLQGEDSAIFQLAAKLSSDVIWDWNLETNEVFRGEGFNEILGAVVTDKKGHIADWKNHIHPDDKEAVENGLAEAIASSANRWEHAFRFIKADGSVADVFDRASILRHAGGKAYRLIGAMHELSRQNELEEQLKQEIILKENQIAEAAEDAKGTVRSDIGKELHDNVNQLLAASRMYLEMARRGGGNVKMYLSRSSEYTSMAIEAIRKLTRGLTNDPIKDLGLCESIDNLVRDTMEAGAIKISFTRKKFNEDSVSDKFKLNVFRVIQEAVNNILRHARATRVNISLLQNKKSIILAVADNGVGFNTGKKQKGIGITNIKSRAAAYNGIADFVSQPGKGCVLTVTFTLQVAEHVKSIDKPVATA